MKREKMEMKKIERGIEKERKTGGSQNNICKRRESQTWASKVDDCVMHGSDRQIERRKKNNKMRCNMADSPFRNFRWSFSDLYRQHGIMYAFTKEI